MKKITKPAKVNSFRRWLQRMVRRLNWSDANFIVKWMIENIDTGNIEINEHYRIEKLTDECHLAYMKWRNEQESA